VSEYAALCYLPLARFAARASAQLAGERGAEVFAVMDKRVIVGIFPDVIVLSGNDQAEWVSPSATLRVEFDPKRCPFSSNVLQAPAGMRLLSGPPVLGTKPGSYKYRVSLNDVVIGTGEILIRES
jgi:hypothetical protein